MFDIFIFVLILFISKLKTSIISYRYKLLFNYTSLKISIKHLFRYINIFDIFNPICIQRGTRFFYSNKKIFIWRIIIGIAAMSFKSSLVVYKHTFLNVWMPLGVSLCNARYLPWYCMCVYLILQLYCHLFLQVLLQFLLLPANVVFVTPRGY